MPIFVLCYVESKLRQLSIEYCDYEVILWCDIVIFYGVVPFITGLAGCNIIASQK